MGTPIGEEKEKKTARISYLGSWKSHLSPLSSHLSIAIAFFFLQVHGRTHFLNSSVPPGIAIRAPMNNGRSSGEGRPTGRRHHIRRETTTRGYPRSTRNLPL